MLSTLQPITNGFELALGAAQAVAASSSPSRNVPAQDARQHRPCRMPKERYADTSSPLAVLI